MAYLVYAERKVLSLHPGAGPMRVGPWGLLQPVADGIKLLLGRYCSAGAADKFVFFVARLTSSPSSPSSIPETFTSATSIFVFILGASSLGIFGIILGGWSSNSHYPLLGALRSGAQLVSYEVAASMALVGVLLISNSLAVVEIVNRQVEHLSPAVGHFSFI